MVRKAQKTVVVQLNKNGRTVVPVQLLDYCRRENVDVLLLQETRTTHGGKLEGFEEYHDRSVFCEVVGGRAMAAIVVTSLVASLQLLV